MRKIIGITTLALVLGSGVVGCDSGKDEKKTDEKKTDEKKDEGKKDEAKAEEKKEDGGGW